MPSFDIVRKLDVKETYRVARVLSDFDMDKSKGDVHFHGDIEIPENWNVGLIYGASGTGKTTLVKELFPDAVVDEFRWGGEVFLTTFKRTSRSRKFQRRYMPSGWAPCLRGFDLSAFCRTARRCASLLPAVCWKGIFLFLTSLLPSWIVRLQSVLSCCFPILQEAQEKIFGGILPQGRCRMARTGFHFLHGRLQTKFSVGPHPKTEFFVRKCGREEWQKFSRYHYLNHELSHTCKCFGLFDEKESIVGFCAVMPFPHPKVSNMRRCSRLVILPDYQGVGLGVKFLTAVAELYKKDGFDFRIVTTLKNFSKSLVKSGKFVLKSCDVARPMSKSSTVGKSWQQNLRKVKTCSFKFVGGAYG